MPTEQTSSQNFELYVAISKTSRSNLHKAIEDIEKFIGLGADLFASVEITPGYYAQSMSDALSMSNPDIIDAIIKSAIKNGVLIDLGRGFVSPSSSQRSSSLNLSIFQYACIFTDTCIVDMFIEYAKKTDQYKNLYKITNEKVVHGVNGNKKRYSVGEFMACAVNARTLLATRMLDKNMHDQPELETISIYLDEWKKQSPATLSSFKQSQKFDKPIHIKFEGRLDVIQLLINNNLLDLDSSTSKDVPYAEFVSTVIKYVTFDDWNSDIRPMIERIGTNSIMAVTQDEKDPQKFTISVKLTNMYGQLPTDFEVKYDLRDLSNIIDKALLEQKSRPRNESIEKLKTGLTQAQQAIAELDETHLKTVRELLSGEKDAIKCFNSIYNTVASLLLANQVASSKILSLKPITKGALIANTAQNIFAIAIQGIPVPYANIIPAVTGVIVASAIKSQQQGQIAAVNNGILGLSIQRIATDVAALVTIQYVKQDFNPDAKPIKLSTLEGLISKQIHSMSGFELYEGDKHMQLVEYLSKTAFSKLHTHIRPQGSNDSPPSPSSSSYSSGNISGDESKPRKPGGKRCSIM